MKPLLLLDLDHTLFDTSAFWQDFMHALAAAAGTHKDTFKDSYDAHVLGEGRLRQIDYQALLKTAGTTDEAVREELTKVASKKQYLYPEALEFLEALKELVPAKLDVEILTFGRPEFQGIKLHFVPELAVLQAHITQVLKTDFISQQFPGRSGYLIDDKPGQDLPEGWTEIHIDRNAASYEPPMQEAEHIIRITNLRDAIGLLV